MDERTLKALHGSVRKWIKIYEGKEMDCGIHNCPLCAEFYENWCAGCPVKDKTRRIQCAGSPYRSFVRAERKYLSHAMNEHLVQEAAAAEALFLISLLPESEQERYMQGHETAPANRLTRNCMPLAPSSRSRGPNDRPDAAMNAVDDEVPR